jgi:hypothetical protein
MAGPWSDLVDRADHALAQFPAQGDTTSRGIKPHVSGAIVGHHHQMRCATTLANGLVFRNFDPIEIALAFVVGRVAAARAALATFGNRG